MTSRHLAPALLLLSLPLFAQPQQDSKSAPEKTTDAKTATAKPDASKPEGLPDDKSVAQTVTANGKTLHYTATVGTIHLKDATGKPTGDVMYTSYVVDKAKGETSRPVLFAFNGGPGASSVYLNLGAIGPKHLSFANAGESASDPAILKDNPGTWLDIADLVFIDPIGTGFSKSLVDEAQTKKPF